LIVVEGGMDLLFIPYGLPLNGKRKKVPSKMDRVKLLRN
jgi:hypothetical protein